ncbi:MAG: hypothetical protein IKN54_05340 [Lachnospiraceae bacterium]|nr:hypothetical protein [Lachnospiraceae bacterium]
MVNNQVARGVFVFIGIGNYIAAETTESYVKVNGTEVEVVKTKNSFLTKKYTPSKLTLVL